MPLKKILINLSTITCCLIGLSIFNKTWASLGGFRSADESQAKHVEQRRTLGSGTRSQCQVTFQPNTITLLVPEDKVVHKTASSQPSFYVQTKTGSKTPLNFTLVDPKISQPVAESLITVSKPGIKKIELPDQVRLEQDKVYLWYLGVPCNNGSEYQEVLTSSVEFVPTSTIVRNELRSSDKNDIVGIYAENGYWYDALEVSLKEDSPSFKQLLLSVGLSF